MAGARPVRGLSADTSFRAAATKIVWTRFDEMMGFASCALEGTDPEGVHDMRVASRRLRAVLEVFAEAFPRKRLKPLLSEVKYLADSLGSVRDLDVQLQRLRADCEHRPAAQQQVLNAMIAEMEGQRDAARAGLREAIDGVERTALARRFLALIERA